MQKLFAYFQKASKGPTGRWLLIFVLSSFSKIRLTADVLACFEYLFKDISLIILAKWQSITLADILTLFRMGFFGAAHGWGGGKKAHPP